MIFLLLISQYSQQEFCFIEYVFEFIFDEVISFAKFIIPYVKAPPEEHR